MEIEEGLKRWELSRRSVFKGLAAVGATAAATGLAVGVGSPAQAALVSHNEISGVPTYYVGNGVQTWFSWDPTFYSTMEVWLNSFNAEPMPLGRFTRIWSDGVYVNKPGYHGSGRAIDLHYFDTAGTSRAFNADYGVWRNWTGTSLTDVRKRYWAIASSLHFYFTYVLTYLYNQEHWTHIHVDDGVSRGSGTRFDTGLSTQVHHVQAVCTYIWNKPTTIDGLWGPQTLANSNYALSQMGINGSLIQYPDTNWDAFNYYSFRKGIGIT
jgi:hypothetical protein